MIRKKETERNIVKIVIVLTKKSAVSKGGSANLLKEIRKLTVGLKMDEFIFVLGSIIKEKNFC